MLGVETNSERRRRKLIELCAERGGERSVAARLREFDPEIRASEASLKQYTKGYSSSYTPKQAGSSPSERGLGDTLARAIEEAFGFERGWLDNDAEAMTKTPQEQELLALFRQLPEDRRRVTVQILREQLTEQERQAELLVSKLRAQSPAPSERTGK